MGQPTQVTGSTSTPAQAQSTGFVGFMVDDDPDALTVQGGASSATLAAAAAWSAGTAYTTGQAVTFGGNTWVARANSTGSTPAFGNANWRNVTAKRGPGQQTDNVSRRKQFYR